MNIQSTTPGHPSATPLRQRMIEDMRARTLGRQSQSNHPHTSERGPCLTRGIPRGLQF